MEALELRAWLRLEMTAGVGNITARGLLQQFGLPQAIFDTPEARLRMCATEKQARALSQTPDGLDALLEDTLRWLEASPDQRRVLTLGDPDYPLHCWTPKTRP